MTTRSSVRVLALSLVVCLAVTPVMGDTIDAATSPLARVWLAIITLQKQITAHVSDSSMHPRAYTFTRRAIPVQPTSTTVAALSVPPGSYVVHASALVDNLAGGQFNAPILCSLVNSEGSSFDFGALALQPFLGGTSISTGTLSLTSAVRLAAAGTIMLDCYNNTGMPTSTAEINIVRLTAHSVVSISDQ